MFDLIIFVTGVALCAYWWRLYRKSVVVRCRFYTFVLRDELFDFASEEKISFDNEAYVLSRQLLNAHIRFFEHLSAFRIFVFWLVTRKEPPSSTITAHKKALARCTTEQREYIERILHEAHLTVLRGLTRRSIFLLGISGLEWLVIRIKKSSVYPVSEWMWSENRNNRIVMAASEGEQASVPPIC